MQRHLILGHQVDALDYVNLSVLRPIYTCTHNNRMSWGCLNNMDEVRLILSIFWSYGATPGQMHYVKDPQGPKIVYVCRRNPNLYQIQELGNSTTK